jgi:hypothetical protein
MLASFSDFSCDSTGKQRKLKNNTIIPAKLVLLQIPLIGFFHALNISQILLILHKISNQCLSPSIRLLLLIFTGISRTGIIILAEQLFHTNKRSAPAFISQYLLEIKKTGIDEQKLNTASK